MTVAPRAGGWQVHRYDLERVSSSLVGLPGCRTDIAAWAGERAVRHGQRFLIGPGGFPDLRVNAFLASPQMRVLAGTTNRDYAYSLALWLNFLVMRGHRWWEAIEDDVAEFQFWRMTDPENEAPVEGSAFSRDVAACKKFYRGGVPMWLSSRCRCGGGFGVPVVGLVAEHGVEHVAAAAG